MIKVLNITNSDAVINIMKNADIMGDFLPWRDFLHEGPVPKNFNFEQLSKIRANFIHQQGLGELKVIYHEFVTRDNILSRFNYYDRIVLWFEHDLYDQLQLLQILAWFAEQQLTKGLKLSLIYTDNHREQYSHQQLLTLSLYDQPVTSKHLNLAKKAWSAFREPTPLEWFNLLEEETSALPFLKDAIIRQLEEYPNTKNGLSRSEHEALLVISHGKQKPYNIFTAYQELEERRFMGDVLFWKILKNFIYYGLVDAQENGQKLTITSLGQEVLSSKKNWLNIKPIQRWIGGVHLTPHNLWCWDFKKKTIAPYYYSTPLNYLLPIKPKRRFLLTP